MWYACGLNKLAHFHSSISQNNIVDFIDDFWGVAASIGRPERGASHVDVQPRLNLFTNYIQSQTLMQMCYEHYPPRLWFLSVLNLSYVDVWSLHETRFFSKKYKGCSL